MTSQAVQMGDLNQAMSQAVHQAHEIDEKTNEHVMNQERIARNAQTIFRQTQELQEERDKCLAARLESENNQRDFNVEHQEHERVRREVHQEKEKSKGLWYIIGAIAVGIIAVLAYSLFRKKR